jgi:pantetheine-phosphate adenylyltransferase
MNTLGICAGSFDPPTKGHLRIIEEALCLFESVTVLVAVNKAKKTLFGQGERVDMLKECLEQHGSRVHVAAWDGLLVDYAPDKHRVLVRGLRTVSDFEAEMTLAHVNETLGIQTLFLPASPSDTTSFVSSSIVRELLAFDLDKAQQFVPESVRPWLARALVRVR